MKEKKEIPMLGKEEINKFKTIYDRIEKAMKRKGYNSIAELNRAIKDKRGRCPDKSMYSKLQIPPRFGQEFYNLSIENLYVIADALEVSTDYLLGLTEVKERVNDIEVNSLGLDDDALLKLKDIKTHAMNYDGRKFRSTSKYYKNPYDKELEALNWIINHIKVDEDEPNNDNYDFLTSVYHLVMLNFDDYRGTMVEAVLNEAQIDAMSEWHNYLDRLYSVKNPVHHMSDEVTRYLAEENEQKLDEARKKIALTNESIKRHYNVLEDIKKGIVAVNDPVTYDEVKVVLADPQEAFEKHILKTISEWNQEYRPIYEKQKQQQEEEYQEWLEKNKDWNWSEIDDEEEEDDNVPEELTYRPRWLWNLKENQMKLYMLLEYLEDIELRLMRINVDGELLFYNIRDFSDEAIDEFIAKAKQDGVGIIRKEDGKIYYVPEQAANTRDRLEKLFFEHILVFHIEDMLRRGETHFSTRAVYDKKAGIYVDYDKEKVARIYSDAKAAGYEWKIDGESILVSKVGFSSYDSYESEERDLNILRESVSKQSE